ncbi:MAG: hypothetical protein H0U74_06470 [Bradymonadaceae bacterium]|nr:hypothetical protein [Lujinxingiaceae bacterium]
MALTQFAVASARAPVTVAPVLGVRQMMEFVHFARKLYADDPHYRSLPDLLVLDQLSARRNPWFEHGEAQLFLARRGNEVVGRISAQIDHEHLKIHDDQAGFFGFFECEDDLDTARALLSVAEDWCRARGLQRMRGPFSFSINEVCGLLVEGFDTPNYVMMAHGRPYYPELLAKLGYEGAMDLFAWRYVREHPPEQVTQIADAVAEYPGLVVRELDMKNLERDVQIIMDIFNDAWSRNWGFVPLTPAEVAKVVTEFRLIADPKICLIAEVDGVPAAMAVALPNINEAFHELDGRLFPLGWARAIYNLKVKRPRTFRQILLGVKKEFRGSVLGGLSLHLYVTIHRNAYARGYEEAEASWTLANNERINYGMSFMGAEHYKTYRIFEKGL